MEVCVASTSSKLNAVIYLRPKEISIEVSKEFMQRNFLRSINLLPIQDDQTNLNENDYVEINCQEIEPSLFSSLLTSHTAISDTRDETVFSVGEKLDNVLGLLRLYRLVKDLKMTEVIVECVEYSLESIVNNNSGDGAINETTACPIFQEARETQFEKLFDKALDIILRYPSVVFEKETNYKMLTVESVQEILSCDDLQLANEAEVLNFGIKWARLEPKNYDERLKKVLPCIRLSQINDEKLLAMVHQKGILKSLQDSRSSQSTSPDAESDDEVPRNYYRPQEKLPNMLVSDILSNLDRIEVTNSCWTTPAKPIEPISITVNKSQLMELGSELKPNSYSQIILYVGHLKTFPKEQLLNYINSSIYGKEIGLKMVVHNVTGASGYNQLVSTLNFFSQQSLNLEELIIDDFNCSIDSLDFIEIPQELPSLTSIKVKSLTTPRNSQIKMLLDKNQCPNLKTIVMGNPSSKFQPTNVHLDEFVYKLNDLNEVEISWLFPLSFQNYPGDEKANDFWLQLEQKGGGISKKVYPFAGTGGTDDVGQKFLVHFGQDLEEIYGLFSSHLHWALSKRMKFENLKLLEVQCSLPILLGSLSSFQRLEKLIWRPGVSSYFESRNKFSLMKRMTVPRLRSIVVITTASHREDLDSLCDLSSICPNVKSLSLRIHVVEFNVLNSTPINFNLVYKKFPEVEEFEVELCENSVTTGLSMGMADESWKSRSHLITSFQGRPPSIGELKKLRALRIARGWPWASKINAFRSTLCRLKNLEEIAFPPMNLETAMEVLEFLSKHVKQLKRIKIQVSHSTLSSSTTEAAEKMDLTFPVKQDIFLKDWDLDSDDGEYFEEVTTELVNFENVEHLKLTYGQFFRLTLEDWVSTSNLHFGARYIPSMELD